MSSASLYSTHPGCAWVLMEPKFVASKSNLNRLLPTGSQGSFHLSCGHSPFLSCPHLIMLLYYTNSPCLQRAFLFYYKEFHSVPQVTVVLFHISMSL